MLDVRLLMFKCTTLRIQLKMSNTHICIIYGLSTVDGYIMGYIGFRFTEGIKCLLTHLSHTYIMAKPFVVKHVCSPLHLKFGLTADSYHKFDLFFLFKILKHQSHNYCKLKSSAKIDIKTITSL